MRLPNKLSLFILAVFTFLFYRFFLSTSPFVAHDWPLLFKESRNFPFWSLSWDYSGGLGLGNPGFKTLWIDLYTNLVYSFSNFVNLPWWLSQRIFWIIPFLLISVVSSYKLSSIFFKEDLLKTVSAIIYTFNSYILLIVGGGQFGIAFAYSLFPLVLYSFNRLFEKNNIRNVILSGLVLGGIIALDPRVALIAIVIILVWFIFFSKDFKKLISLSWTFLISISLNSYWIVSIILTRNSSLSLNNYASVAGVKFLSFAAFSNSLSLLSPNWPENIFGKVYFMKPEFIVIPILAFSFLVFREKTKISSKILFFALLGLVAAFLSKGTSEPFGQIYEWMFNHLPGFVLFRDSTKFYILIALSYSLLIPFSLSFFSKRFKILSIAIFLIFWIFTLREGVLGDLNGVFKPSLIPLEYQTLNNFLKNQKTFSRTLWLPKTQKFGLFDPNHPEVDGSTFYNSTNLKSLAGKLKEDELSKDSIKYIIVPWDIDSEIFLKDRKYDEIQYRNTAANLSKLSFLKEIKGFGKIKVFEIYNSKEHFWSPSSNLKINYNFKSPAEYEVSLENAKKGDLLVFSEGFDSNWKADSIGSKSYNNNSNSFTLIRDGNYKLTVYYEPQKWVNLGLIISTISLFSALSYLIFGYKANK